MSRLIVVLGSMHQSLKDGVEAIVFGCNRQFRDLSALLEESWSLIAPLFWLGLRYKRQRCESALFPVADCAGSRSRDCRGSRVFLR